MDTNKTTWAWPLSVMASEESFLVGIFWLQNEDTWEGSTWVRVNLEMWAALNPRRVRTGCRGRMSPLFSQGARNISQREGKEALAQAKKTKVEKMKQSQGARGQRGRRKKPKKLRWLFKIMKKSQYKAREKKLLRSLRLSNFNQLQSTMSTLKASYLKYVILSGR